MTCEFAQGHNVYSTLHFSPIRYPYTFSEIRSICSRDIIHTRNWPPPTLTSTPEIRTDTNILLTMGGDIIKEREREKEMDEYQLHKIRDGQKYKGQLHIRKETEKQWNYTYSVILHDLV